MAQLVSCNPHNRSKSIALFDLEVSRNQNHHTLNSLDQENQAGMGLTVTLRLSHHGCSNVTIHSGRH
jgi:hypothetical protein